MLLCLLSLFSLFLQSTALVQDWETRFQSNYYLLRSVYSQPQAVSIPIVLVMIDDHSLPIGTSRSPLDRQWLARLVNAIAADKPALIGLDILFERPGQEADDQALVSAIAKAGNVILRSDPHYPVLPRFAKAALDQGTVKFRFDSSATLQEICNNQTTCQSRDIFHQKIYSHFQTFTGQEKTIPPIENPWLKINFSHIYNLSSKKKILNFPILRAHEIENLPEHSLRGKLILIGSGFPDLYPLYRIPLAAEKQLIQQTEVLAHLLTMMAQESYFQQISPLQVSLILAGVLLLLSFVLVYVGMLQSIGIFIIFLSGFFFLSGSAFAFWNVEIPFVLPASLLTVFIISATMLQTVQEKLFRLATELQLKQAKIDFLTNELHSHNLFNEFSRVSVMIRHNPESAREYLVEFAEMLRASLKYSGQPQVAIPHHIEYLEGYIRQQQIIYQQQLRFELKVEGNWDQIHAPWQVFFPLLENAVKYTESLIKKSTDSVTSIQIELIRRRKFLVFTVKNQFDKDVKPVSSKTGLKNLRDRLEWSYPNGGYKLDLFQEDNNWISQLQLPLQ